MKKLIPKVQILFFALFFSCVSYAQKQSAEPHIFSSTERDSLQLWFYDRATVMGLQAEERDEFYNIILYHSFKMKNLSDPEKGLTNEEIKSKFKILLEKQNLEVRQLLNNKQYNYYLELIPAFPTVDTV